MTDGQLLGRFLERPEPASQVAFEALVRRHGPMVLSLCRGVFATSMTPPTPSRRRFSSWPAEIEHPRSRPPGHMAGPGGQADRPAFPGRGVSSRRPRAATVPRRFNAAPAPVDSPDSRPRRWSAEVDRLPEADRLLLQLTYWQGKTYEEAAGLLSWPIGTVRSRLSRVRERLRRSLTRLGLAPTLGIAGPPAPAHETPAMQPAEVLILQTVRAATRHAEGFKRPSKPVVSRRRWPGW